MPVVVAAAAGMVPGGWVTAVIAGAVTAPQKLAVPLSIGPGTVPAPVGS